MILDLFFDPYNPIALIFLSYGVGALLIPVSKKLEFYDLFLNQNFINDSLTKSLGVLVLRWLIRNTFMGSFNKRLQYSGKASQASLLDLKKVMNDAEISHLFGFIALFIVNIIMIFKGGTYFEIISLMVLNIIFNLYLVFLQQYNKRRIDRILKLITSE